MTEDGAKTTFYLTALSHTHYDRMTAGTHFVVGGAGATIQHCGQGTGAWPLPLLGAGNGQTH